MGKKELQGEIKINEKAAVKTKIGYVRIGNRTQGSTTAKYYEALTRVGVYKVFIDTEPAQPMLDKLLATVTAGDTVYVESLNRLCRNLKKLTDVLSKLKQNGVRFISLREKFDSDVPRYETALLILQWLADAERAEAARCRAFARHAKQTASKAKMGT